MIQISVRVNYGKSSAVFTKI